MLEAWICQSSHSLPCSKCEGFLNIAKLFLEQGHVNLSNTFAILAPMKRYTSEHASILLLWCPFVSEIQIKVTLLAF